jgi:hypothetical protein
VPRRVILTDRQRAALFDLPSDAALILRHYILSDADLALVNRRQGTANRIGFCLQLCAFRYPGRLIQPGEVIPRPMLDFVAAQLGLAPDAVAPYAVTGTTHYRHSADLQRLLEYRPCAGRALEDIKAWLVEAAGSARATVDLATDCLEEMRRRAIIVPGPTTVERLSATALVTAETRAISTIADRLDQATRARLNTLITETADGRVSRFVWVRQIESGRNSAAMSRLLDRLDVLQGLGVPEDVVAGVPTRQIERLRGEGDRLYVDSLRKIPPDRRFAILATSVVEWRAALLDAVIETQDRILGKIFREAKAQYAAVLEAGKTPITDVLRSLAGLATALVTARRDAEDLDEAVQQAIGWDALPGLATDAMRLTSKVDTDVLDHVGLGYGRIRRYAPRLLGAVRFEGSRPARRLLAQIDVLRAMNAQARRRLPPEVNAAFASSKWRKRIVGPDGAIDPKLWEVGLMFALRDRLRAGDVWVRGARRYRGRTSSRVICRHLRDQSTSPRSP